MKCKNVNFSFEKNVINVDYQKDEQPEKRIERKTHSDQEQDIKETND